MQNKYPQLKYDRDRSIIKGPVPINHTYQGTTIKEVFQIKINLWAMRNRKEYPHVYNTDGRIRKIAKRKKINHIDLHVYDNDRLCLGLPERFSEYYPLDFELPLFFKHLSEHLYWIAYYERYNQAPWLAEKHGNDARIEYYIEKQDVNNLRIFYKLKLGKGISSSKLRNYLSSPELKNKLIKQLL
ncbi:hypothetical protein [Porphyromonas endodontalis]